jgi:hypothetical protein
MSTKKNLPKVKCRLVGRDGNFFAILVRFRRAARKAGWSVEDLAVVLEEAMSSDDEHLVATIAKHCENPSLAPLSPASVRMRQRRA